MGWSPLYPHTAPAQNPQKPAEVPAVTFVWSSTFKNEIRPINPLDNTIVPICEAHSCLIGEVPPLTAKVPTQKNATVTHTVEQRAAALLAPLPLHRL